MWPVPISVSHIFKVIRLSTRNKMRDIYTPSVIASVPNGGRQIPVMIVEHQLMFCFNFDTVA